MEEKRVEVRSMVRIWMRERSSNWLIREGQGFWEGERKAGSQREHPGEERDGEGSSRR